MSKQDYLVEIIGWLLFILVPYFLGAIALFLFIMDIIDDYDYYIEVVKENRSSSMFDDMNIALAVSLSHICYSYFMIEILTLLIY
jgi:hypothetical protein